MSRDSRDILSPRGKNVHWQEHEIRELMSIRASEGVRRSITGTVKDGVVYARVSRMLADRGVHRTQVQVISKLKYLKKKYVLYHRQRLRGGAGAVSWPFYDQCHLAFGAPPAPPGGEEDEEEEEEEVVVVVPPPPSSSSGPSPQARSPAASEADEKHHEVVVSLWDEMDDRGVGEHLEPVEEEDDDQYSPPAQKQPIKTTYAAPEKKKRRRTTVMEQVSTLVSATVAQLREMDAAMQAQEDARLQRLMDHDREMQSGLIGQLAAMHERINKENHQRHLDLVDRILSRLPSNPQHS